MSSTAYGTVERNIHLSAPAATVWRAFSDGEVRARWLALPGTDRRCDLDFRTGGTEHQSATFTSLEQTEHIALDTTFHLVEPERRIAQTVELRLEGVFRLLSIQTWEFETADGGCELRYLDQWQSFSPINGGKDDAGERNGGADMLLRRLKYAVEP